MKAMFAAICLCVLALPLLPAQEKKPRVSPAETATATVNGKAITITYSSPRVKGREGKIFAKDGLISHDPHFPVWRGGANEATTLTTEADLRFGTLAVPRGTYTLFVDLTDSDHWVLIVSKMTGEWGLAYDPAQDLGRVPMEMSKPASMVEDLVYTIDPAGAITLEWEDRSATVHFAAM